MEAAYLDWESLWFKRPEFQSQLCYYLADGRWSKLLTHFEIPFAHLAAGIVAPTSLSGCEVKLGLLPTCRSGHCCYSV